MRKLALVTIGVLVLVGVADPRVDGNDMADDLPPNWQGAPRGPAFRADRFIRRVWEMVPAMPDGARSHYAEPERDMVSGPISG